ncbi:restriction endonuclease [Bifidobacterium pseudolongum subsp. globosum]|uniref:Restriction endonuclease n=2 Tax=Bifidobacterium pseudolongum TaxID=1694 RepID=A0A2N3QV04_9BIFI|nr:restriction endonuclease [Bifidobacterium pseudolongum subsp. globosum]RYQ76236.1 restriction endonuclease [Bifidobacterium pseudolongum subsp. globosum]
MVKKLQPKLRFRGFTDAWEQRKLGRICRITMGQSPKGQNYTNDFNQYILVQGNADIVDRWVQPRVWTKEVTKTAEAGDLILSVRAPVGVVAKTAFPIVLGRGVAGIKGGEYIYQFLFMLEANNYWKSLSSGSTFDSITKEQLIDLPVRQPASEQERNRIGKLLHILDSILAAEKRKLDLLQKKKRALLRQIFEQKLRFAGYNNPWERCRLGDITEFADYGIAASAIPYDGTVRYLRITDIDDETRQVNIYELPSPDMKHRSRKEDYLRQGDLVFARTGASVGKTYLNRSDRDDIVHAGFLIRFRLKDNICPEFIYQQTLGENYRKFIAITSQRSGQPGINSSEYADWTLYLTSIEEQNQIGGLFGQLDELIAALTQKIDLLMIKKKALLQQMFV